MCNSRSPCAINTWGSQTIFFLTDLIADTATGHHILRMGTVFTACAGNWDWDERGADRNIFPFQFVEEDSSSRLKGQAVTPEVEIIAELSGNIIAP